MDRSIREVFIEVLLEEGIEMIDNITFDVGYVAAKAEMMEEIDRLARLCEAKDVEIDGLIKRNNEMAEQHQADVEKISEAQAQIAMKDEALNECRTFIKCEEIPSREVLEAIETSISATSETVAAWRAKETEKIRVAAYEAGYSRCMEDNFVGADEAAEIHANGRREAAKETEPLRREVAMLHEIAEMLHTSFVDCVEGGDADEVMKLTRKTLDDTQATALAYEREVKAKALEDVAGQLRKIGHDSTAKALVSMAAELRAANKGEVK